MSSLEFKDPNTNEWVKAGRSRAKSVFSGKTASFYGDSLTGQNYHYTKGYHKWVSEILGLNPSYNNYGRSGMSTADVYRKVCEVKDDADIVFVMTGGNDQNNDVPLGAFGDTTTDTIYGSFHLLCTALKQKYPTSIIVYITEHYQTKYPHAEGITSYDIAKVAKQVCEKFAIPVYNNFTLSGIYRSNLSVFTTDNCHWNDMGHEMLGKNLAQFMKDTFRYVPGHDNFEVGAPEIISNSLDSASLDGNALVMSGATQTAYGVILRNAKKVEIRNISNTRTIGWFFVGSEGNYRLVTAGAGTTADGFFGEAYTTDIWLKTFQNRESNLFDPVESFSTMTAEVVDGVTHIYVDDQEFYSIEGCTIGYVVTAQKNATFYISVE